jgi:VCBS repeat-containing protein
MSASLITGTKTGVAVEDGTDSISGTVLTDTAGAAHNGFIAQVETPGLYGIFSLTTAGEWTYKLSNDLDYVQQLRQDETVFDTFLVSYESKEFSTVRIQIVGKNDLPTMVGDLALSLSPTEKKVTSTLKVVDADLDQSAFRAVDQLKGSFGTFSITKSGAIEYTVDSPGGQPVGRTDQFVISTVDGTELTIKVVVTDPNASQDTTPIAGGPGIDIVQLTGPRASYSLIRQINGDWNIEGQSHQVLSGIERLQFSDTYIALDVDGNAGKVARVLGAVFGPAAVQNARYVGIGLGLLDGGMSYEKLMELAIDTALGADVSSTQIVNRLYTNVVGVPPNATNEAPFVSLLDNGSVTRGGLGVLAAETDINAANIGLVGLQETGIAYTLS